MRVLQDIEELKSIRFSSVSIGNFDGVHLGHRAIIKKLTRSPDSLVVTFSPHPMEMFAPEETANRPALITETDEKTDLIEKLGVENLFTLKFDKQLADIQAEDFIRWLVADYISPQEVVLGYNHRFGKEAKGGFELLVHLGTKFGFKATRVPPVYVQGFPVSSTWVRRVLFEGKVEIAHKLLGRPYSFLSQVVQGEGRGTEVLSFPTANLQAPHKKLLPRNGVYAVRVEYDRERFTGMMNVGEKPTFPGSPGPGIEVHIFDFDKNLLGESLKVEFIEYLRETQVFKDSNALKVQLQKDEKKARQLLS
jgi:riboflavin kinase/FMN adenylyltransferase